MIKLFLFKGLYMVIISLLIAFIFDVNIYISIFVFLIILLIPYILMYIQSKRNNKPFKYSYHLKQKYNLNIYIKQTNSNVGYLEHNYFSIHRLYIPDINPKLQNVVLYHEIAHLLHKDFEKYHILKYNLIVLQVCIFYIFITNKNVLLIFSILFMLLSPLILNYINHTFEYKADKFAKEKTCAQHVSTRIRQNNNREDSWIKLKIPYISSHPPVKNRLQKIHNDN